MQVESCLHVENASRLAPAGAVQASNRRRRLLASRSPASMAKVRIVPCLPFSLKSLMHTRLFYGLSFFRSVPLLHSEIIYDTLNTT